MTKIRYKVDLEGLWRGRWWLPHPLKGLNLVFVVWLVLNVSP